jgi:hypothetical protein
MFLVIPPGITLPPEEGRRQITLTVVDDDVTAWMISHGYPSQNHFSSDFL